MPDKKISEFQTFTGITGSDVFFVIASGKTENSNAENYKIPFDDLKSDLGLDAGGGGPVIGGDESNINFGGTEPGDVRDINFQQGGENIMVINQDGDVNMQNDLYVSGGISGDSGSFQTLNISEGLIASGGISGDSGSFQTLNISEGLIASGGISGDSGSFQTLNISEGLIASGGISGDSGSFQTLNISEGLIASGGISGDSGSFQTLNISEGLIASGGISGDVISGKSGFFSDSLSSPTGYFEKIIVSGDAYISGDFYVSGTTYVNEVVDTTVSGTLSGYTGIFNMTSGENASFTQSLTISGVPVSTGAGGTVGGLPVVGGDNDNIDFGGTEPGDVRDINFQQGGENIMVINQDGDVNMQNDLYVSGGISGDIISGKTGVFTESLTLSGVSVLTGNQQASIQWLEDIGNGQLTVKESSVNGINFTNTKWYDSLQSNGDIYYNEGKVGLNNDDPQAELDVSGDIYSERIKIGNVIVYSDNDDNLIFDTE